MNVKYLLPLLFVVACSSSPSSSDDKQLEAKKEALKKARKELQEVKKRVATLEKEISQLDPSAIRRNATLVMVVGSAKKPFEHKIEARGSVKSRKNVQISAQTSGEVERIYVKEGQAVKKGELLLSINADVLNNTIKEYITALDLAATMYQKQKKLWSQKVGSEVEYLKAKNSKESLERKLATARSQLRQARIKAPFTGTVESVQTKEGELAGPGMPLLRVVSPKALYIQADVSERYLGQFQTGDTADVFFPNQNKEMRTTIKALGKVINEKNRTFTIELQTPKVSFPLSPNQVVVIQLRDYYNEEAWVVPTRIIQQDSKGEFVFCVAKKDGRSIAKKRPIKIGDTYKGDTEVTEGLNGQELIVYQGFRDLVDGSEVKVTAADAASVEEKGKEKKQS